MVEGEDEEVANYSDDQSHIIKTRNVKKKAAGKAFYNFKTL
jgi:hypothetical protein